MKLILGAAGFYWVLHWPLAAQLWVAVAVVLWAMDAPCREAARGREAQAARDLRFKLEGEEIEQAHQKMMAELRQEKSA
jgi:hypothetical protein